VGERCRGCENEGGGDRRRGEGGVERGSGGGQGGVTGGGGVRCERKGGGEGAKR